VPRYHFDLHDGAGLVVDEEGRELPDLAAVRREAVKGIRSVVSAEVERGTLDLTGRLVVRDGGGAEVLVMTFDEALAIAGSWSPPEPRERRA
jgi:hypothetical protein